MCEGLLTEDKAWIAIKCFPNNKTPGSDGIIAEFYKTFWHDIKKPLIECLNNAFLKGELSITQRQGIISLIPKKKKERSILGNWRPILTQHGL